jgi:hypothetical protein
MFASQSEHRRNTTSRPAIFIEIAMSGVFAHPVQVIPASLPESPALLSAGADHF